MNRSIIGIAGNKETPGSNPFFDVVSAYTPDNFIQGIYQAGGLPMMLPLTHPKLAKEYIAHVDKLLLAGGQDITPQLFDEEPHPLLQQTDIERDLFEQALIKEAIIQKKPIFAVCRGMQLVNVTLGGNLYQDLSSYDLWKIQHNQTSNPHYPSHSVTIQHDSLLKTITKASTLQVNSFHHQAIKTVAPDLIATAHSQDGLVEALEHRFLPIFGVQWHPELSFDKNPADFALFEYFVTH